MDGFTVAGIKVGALVFTFYCQQPVAGVYSCYEPTHGYTYAGNAPLTENSFAAYNERVTAQLAVQDACKMRGWHWSFGHLPSGVIAAVPTGGGAGWYCAP